MGPVEVKGKKLEKIDIDVTAVVQTPNEADKPTLIKLKKQSATGSIYFDATAGHMSHSVFVQNMTMEVMIVGTSAEQQIDQTVTVRLIPTEN